MTDEERDKPERLIPQSAPEWLMRREPLRA